MDRRDVLHMGGVLGLAAAGEAGCVRGLLPRRLPPAEVDAIVGKLDRDLDRLARYDLLDEFARGARTGKRYDDDSRALARASMRSLYTSATFRGLPEELRVEPAVQERVLARVDEMDDAVLGMTDRLRDLSGEQQRRVSALLRDARTDPEAIGGVFDRGMRALEMPLPRRLQARSIFKQVGWRLQHHPAAMIDEYVMKVEKVAAVDGADAEAQRRLAAQIGKRTYWEHQRRLAMRFDEQDPATGGASPAAGAVVTPASTDEQVRELLAGIRAAVAAGQCATVRDQGARLAAIDAEAYRTRFLGDADVARCLKVLQAAEQRAVTPAVAPCEDVEKLAARLAKRKVRGTGGRMLGIGLVTGVVSILAVAAGSEGLAVFGLIGLTLGAALLVGGLIVLIVASGMDSGT